MLLTYWIIRGKTKQSWKLENARNCVLNLKQLFDTCSQHTEASEARSMACNVNEIMPRNCTHLLFLLCAGSRK